MTTTTTTAPASSRVALPRRTSPARWFSDLGWRHLVGVLAVVYAGFPLVYVVSASLADGGTLTGSNELFASVSTANYVSPSAT